MWRNVIRYGVGGQPRVRLADAGSTPTFYASSPPLASPPRPPLSPSPSPAPALFGQSVSRRSGGKQELSPYSAHLVTSALFLLKLVLEDEASSLSQSGSGPPRLFFSSRLVLQTPCPQPGTSCAATTLRPLVISTRQQTRKYSHLLGRALTPGPGVAQKRAAARHPERGRFPGGAHAENRALARGLRRTLGHAGSSLPLLARRSARGWHRRLRERLDGTLFMRVPALTFD